MNILQNNSSKLFSKLKIRGINLPNRIVLSPLCMYSAKDGHPNEWHFSHLSTFARARVGLIFTEATAVQKIGRITPHCLGIWKDSQIKSFKPIVQFISQMGSIPAIQLAHAGRKASTSSPWEGGQPIKQSTKYLNKWNIVGPSSLPLSKTWPKPKAMNKKDINKIIIDIKKAAQRSIKAGFKVIEIHAAHGYLLHSFLSPISNNRTDEYGGDLKRRSKLLIEVVQTVRKAIPKSIPIFCRISAIDGKENGWKIDDSLYLSKKLKQVGVDVIDCSSGGIIGAPRFRVNDNDKPLKSDIERGLGFQVPFAEEIKKSIGIKTMAVGVIINPFQAEKILKSGQADLIALGRELMYNPFWPLHAAQELNTDDNYRLWPDQYRWAVNRRAAIYKTIKLNK